jgi:hypothetical protein
MTSILKKGASKEDIQKVLLRANKNSKEKKADISKFSGAIKLKENPVDIQKRTRN